MSDGTVYGRNELISPPASYHQPWAAGPSPVSLIPRRAPRDSAVTRTPATNPSTARRARGDSGAPTTPARVCSADSESLDKVMERDDVSG